MNTTLEFRRLSRSTVLGTVTHAGRGRTDYPRQVTVSTPVVVTSNSNHPPRVEGYGYWKTTIRNGSFNKTLYTPSTLCVVVGEKWKP